MIRARRMTPHPEDRGEPPHRMAASADPGRFPSGRYPDRQGPQDACTLPGIQPVERRAEPLPRKIGPQIGINLRQRLLYAGIDGIGSRTVDLNAEHAQILGIVLRTAVGQADRSRTMLGKRPVVRRVEQELPGQRLQFVGRTLPPVSYGPGKHAPPGIDRHQETVALRNLQAERIGKQRVPRNTLHHVTWHHAGFRPVGRRSDAGREHPGDLAAGRFVAYAQHTGLAHLLL